MSTRDDVMACVRRFPGIHVRGVEQELGVSAALVHYHVRALASERRVTTAQVGGYLRIYPTGAEAAVSQEDADLLAMLREETALHIVLSLLESGPTTQTALADAMGVAKSTVSYHVARLERRGLVERRARGASRLVAVRDRRRVRALLLRHAPTSGLVDRFRELWDAFYE